MSNGGAYPRVLNVQSVQEMPAWRRDAQDPREAERERRRALRALDVHRPLPAFRPDDSDDEKKPPACAYLCILWGDVQASEVAATLPMLLLWRAFSLVGAECRPFTPLSLVSLSHDPVFQVPSVARSFR